MSAALTVLALILALVELAAWIGLRRLREDLRGQRGFELVTIVYRVATIMALAQLVTFVNAALLFADRIGTVDFRTAVFLAIEVAQAAALVYAFVRIDRLARADRGPTMRRNNLSR